MVWRKGKVEYRQEAKRRNTHHSLKVVPSVARLPNLPKEVIMAAREEIVHVLAGGALECAEIVKRCGDGMDALLLSCLLKEVAEPTEHGWQLQARADVWGNVNVNGEKKKKRAFHPLDSFAYRHPFYFRSNTDCSTKVEHS